MGKRPSGEPERRFIKDDQRSLKIEPFTCASMGNRIICRSILCSTKQTLQKLSVEVRNPPALSLLSWLGAFGFLFVPVSTEQFRLQKKSLSTISGKKNHSQPPFKGFYVSGINKLVERWETVVKIKVDYILHLYMFCFVCVCNFFLIF